MKEKLLARCFELQSEVVENIEHAMDEAQKSANEYGQEKDRYDSYRTQLLRKRDMFARQLQQALDRFEILKRIDASAVYERVGFGSAVVTNRQNMFISIGLGRFEMDNKTWYAISPQVPVYESMKGLKQGDSFVFRGQKTIIEDVF